MRRPLRLRLAGILPLLVLGSAPPAVAADAVLIEAGRTFTRDRDIETVRVGLAWDWGREWPVGERWLARGHWETSLGHWRGQGKEGVHETWDLMVSPMLRLWRTNPEGLQPYLETGVGLHYLNDSSFSDALRTGTRYQFGVVLGAGVRFGPGGRYELGWRLRHISNAGIRLPNFGVNASELRLQIHY